MSGSTGGSLCYGRSVPVAVGLTLPPDEEFLDRCRPLLELVDYAEVAPETLWRVSRDSSVVGSVVDNGYAAAIADLVQRASLFCVSHGVGLSLGAVDDDPARVALWEARLRDNHARFSFQWMSDHSGLTTTAGLHLALPVPVPPTVARAAATATKLRLLRSICRGPALVETSALPFLVGDFRDEAALIAACVEQDGAHQGLGINLDLHNAWTMAENLGFDVDDFVGRLPLDQVVAIHVSGGTRSDPGWLPGGRTVRLDSHDGAVPDEVFALLARVAPRCPQLLGVTLERLEGTIGAAGGDDDDVPRLAQELRTIRDIVGRPQMAQTTAPPHRPLFATDEDVDDGAWARAFLAADPIGAVGALIGAAALADERQQDGVRTAALLIAKLRFERLLNGDDGSVVAEFERGPAAFAAKFKRYHRAVLPTSWHPPGEAALWRSFPG